MSLINVSQLVENYSILTVHGKREAYVENFNSIMELSDTLIKIKAKKEIVIFEGNGLLVEYMNEDDIKIVGNIEHIRLVEVSH